MTRDEMLYELRVLLDDVYTPQRWTDATLLSLLSEGQDRFCEATGYFVDIANYTLTLATGVAVYAIPPRTIQVMNIWDGSRRLGKVLQDSVTYNDQWPEDLGAASTGLPSHWRTDQTTGFIQLLQTPTVTENGRILTLHVWRYSRYDLAGEGEVPESGPTPPASPEIPSRFHRACIEWAAYGALSYRTNKLADRQDVAISSHDKAVAATHKSRFDAYTLEGLNALRRIQNIEVRVGTDPAYRT